MATSLQKLLNYSNEGCTNKNFSGVFAEVTTFKDAVFRGSDFDEVRFMDCSFENVDFDKVNFWGSKFFDCHLNSVSFRNSQFAGGMFAGSFLDNGDFTEATFRATDIAGGKFDNSNFTRAALIDLDATKSSFRNSNFTDADLTGTDFSNAVLTGANFTGADLTGANFTDADLTGATLTGALAEYAIWKDTELAEVTSLPQKIRFSESFLIADEEEKIVCLEGLSDSYSIQRRIKLQEDVLRAIKSLDDFYADPSGKALRRAHGSYPIHSSKWLHLLWRHKVKPADCYPFFNSKENGWYAKDLVKYLVYSGLANPEKVKSDLIEIMTGNADKIAIGQAANVLALIYLIQGENTAFESLYMNSKSNVKVQVLEALGSHIHLVRMKDLKSITTLAPYAAVIRKGLTASDKQKAVTLDFLYQALHWCKTDLNDFIPQILAVLEKSQPARVSKALELISKQLHFDTKYKTDPVSGSTTVVSQFVNPALIERFDLVAKYLNPDNQKSRSVASEASILVTKCGRIFTPEQLKNAKFKESIPAQQLKRMGLSK